MHVTRCTVISKKRSNFDTGAGFTINRCSLCCARTFKPPRSREISMHTVARYSAINPESGRRRVILIASPFAPRSLLVENNNSSAVERLEHVASTSLCVLTDTTRRSIVSFLLWTVTLHIDVSRNGFQGRKRNVKMETSASLNSGIFSDF